MSFDRGATTWRRYSMRAQVLKNCLRCGAEPPGQATGWAYRVAGTGRYGTRTEVICPPCLAAESPLLDRTGLPSGQNRGRA